MKGQFKKSSNAENVEILVPVPVDASSPKFKVSEVPHASVEPLHPLTSLPLAPHTHIYSVDLRWDG